MTTKTTSSKRSATKDSKEESAPVDQPVTEQTSTTVETQTVAASPKEAETSTKGAKGSKGGAKAAKEAASAPSEAPVAASKASSSKAASAKTAAPAKASTKGAKASPAADATQSPTIKAPKHLKVAKKSAKDGAEQQGEDEEQLPGKRYFKCIMIDGEGNAISNGRYSGKKPKQAASKACTRLYDDMKKNGQTPEQIIFGMHECTRANKKKKKYFYVGKRIALDEPEEVTIKKSDGKQMVIQYHFNNDVRKLTDLDNCQEYALLANYDAKRNENGEEIVAEPVKKARGGAKRGKVAKAKKATGTGKGKKADAKKAPKAKAAKGAKAAKAPKAAAVSSEATADQQPAVEPAKQSAKAPKAAKKQPAAKPAKKVNAKQAKAAKPATKQAKA